MVNVQSATIQDHTSPSKKLLQRFRRLVKFALLEVVPPTPTLEFGVAPLNSAYTSESNDPRIRGIVPHLAISVAIAFEDEAARNALWVELQDRGITTVPAQAVALANSYYYNDRANNVRHESMCRGNPQPANGWRVITTPGHLSCECNFFFKKNSARTCEAYRCPLGALVETLPSEARLLRDSLADAEVEEPLEEMAEETFAVDEVLDHH
ncbi:hypothetical protein H257_14297 [Aphanomyces astaci]|uniref:Uncharacterized protein n=1 Tax=Aphanomyces astaci TaxID=112090 RepID=W4FRP3_APHAT|nr:hypothetical protein H257_14297 [Aphanomyces astaci]ETV70137.1 hypothetical protein H257_14297 [Aphanomyces astaci]|eukprot:XP_009840368.1 hypothetical protein H257_14297 [Aphanomyces astaci]